MLKPSEMESTSLEGLSLRQRGRVESHLPLVHLTLRRHTGLCRKNRPGRERAELFQEGCLALVDAVRSHEPVRHGSFAAYAMSRIHFAVSSFAQEQNSLVRVPFISQRRERDRRREAGECGNGDIGPVVVPFEESHDSIQRGADRRASRSAAHEGDIGPTVGELVRERFDEAADLAVREISAAARGKADARAVVDACLRERWVIPDAECRTPIRQLARSLACSVGRITHCEGRFREKVARSLLCDRQFLALARLAKSHPGGMRHRPSTDELDVVGTHGPSRKSDPR